MKVCKFGGTSLADANQFKKVKDIIDSDPARKIIVVSAPGKRNSSDIKITDSLLAIYQAINDDKDYSLIWNEIKKRYNEIIADLNLKINLSNQFDSYEKRFQSKDITKDEIASLGEFFSAQIMAEFLGFEFIDARRVIKFNNSSKINEYATLVACENINVNNGIVIPGFYGLKQDGNIAIFSRGGSDVTGSYVAKGFKAEMYENWTDVSGICMSDPKLIKNPRRLTEISYLELRELSYLGASMFHEDALFPLFDYPLPLVIKNTNKPDDAGTKILKEVNDNKHLISGVTGKKNFVSVTFVKARAADKLKVMLDVLNIFQKYRIPVEHIPSSIDTFSVIVDKNKFKTYEERLMDGFSRVDYIMQVTTDEDIALIAIVGSNMKNKTGMSGQIMTTLGDHNINIKVISQSRGEISIILGISNDDFDQSITTLYNRFADETI